MKTRSWGWLALALILAAGAADAASDKKPEAKPTAEPVSDDPQTTTASYGDWTERCQRLNLSDGVRRVCEVAETITASGQNTPLADVALSRAKKGAPLKVTLVLPVNVSFPSAPRITAPGAEPVDLAWRQCLPAGCFAEAVLPSDAQQVWRAGKSAKVESKAASGATFGFEISLRGLPQALDALAKEP